jgi:perosamine synthetase
MIKLENKFVNLDKSDLESTKLALSQKQLSGTAQIVKQFETSCCNYFKSKYALTCSSGTAGIELILRSLNISVGDEVILPPTVPVMCVLPIIAVGATPVFCDLESEFNFDLKIEDIKKKFSLKTRAILAVPMCWIFVINIISI